MSPRTRRWTALTLTLALGALAACGGDDDDVATATTTAATSASAPATTPSGTERSVVSSTTGATSVEEIAVETSAPESTERVIAIGEESLLADLLAVGITPVASTATVVDAGFQGRARAAADEAVADDCQLSLGVIYPGPAPAAFVAGPWEIPSAIIDAGCSLVPDTSQAAPDRNGRAYLSMEQLGLFAAPRLVLLQNESVEGETEAIEAIEADPLWHTLPAVAAGNVATVDRLGYPGAEGTLRFLGELPAVVNG